MYELYQQIFISNDEMCNGALTNATENYGDDIHLSLKIQLFDDDYQNHYLRGKEIQITLNEKKFLESFATYTYIPLNLLEITEITSHKQLHSTNLILNVFDNFFFFFFLFFLSRG